MKTEIRTCRICSAEIRCALTRIGGGELNPYVEMQSDEGVFFPVNHHPNIKKKNFVSGVWFCNGCWGKLIKKVKWKTKIRKRRIISKEAINKFLGKT